MNTNLIKEKECSFCNQAFLLIDFLNFGKISPKCKYCHDEYRKLKKEEKKRCKDCKEIKLITDFDKAGKTYNCVTSRCKKCQIIKYGEQKKKYMQENRLILLEKQRIKRKNNPEHNLWKAAKVRAKRENLPFNIEVSDIIIPEFCPILGIELKVGKNTPLPNSPSLDKINSKLGYIKGNVSVISYRANMLKNNMTKEILQKILAYINKEIP